MPAPKKNQFWKARTKHGRDLLFESSELLWVACTEYFEWVDANPLIATELVKFQGRYKTAKINKMRAMTIKGLCIFLDIDESTWRDWRTRDDFSLVTSRVDAIIQTQKFEGAAAELLNPNIIARDLGLSDKKELTGADGSQLMPDSITFVPHVPEEDDDSAG